LTVSPEPTSMASSEKRAFLVRSPVST
jgi:hypothetical protein